MGVPPLPGTKRLTDFVLQRVLILGGNPLRINLMEVGATPGATLSQNAHIAGNRSRFKIFYETAGKLALP